MYCSILKPPGVGCAAKITDYGLSKSAALHGPTVGVVGTKTYYTPDFADNAYESDTDNAGELLAAGYGTDLDLWALGILAYDRCCHSAPPPVLVCP